MNCQIHHKKAEFACGWCGKQLCKDCMFEKRGIKFYCSNCASKLGKLPKSNSLPKVTTPGMPKKKSGSIDVAQLETYD